jgi:hypothetical protein
VKKSTLLCAETKRIKAAQSSIDWTSILLHRGNTVFGGERLSEQDSDMEPRPADHTGVTGSLERAALRIGRLQIGP